MKKTIFKNKKGIGLLLFPTLAFIVGLILFLTFKAPNLDDVIGSKQAAILQTVGLGEEQLAFVDTAARMAAFDSINDLAANGGFYSDVGDDSNGLTEQYPCDRFGYNLWNDKSTQCWPSADNLKKAYQSYFEKTLKEDYFSQHPEKAFSGIDYVYQTEFTTSGKIVLAGITQESVPIPIVSQRRMAYKETFYSDKIPDKEPIVKCCDGQCVANIAERFYSLYGPSGSVKLPYVWGGATPYPIQDTLNDQKKKGKESFFDGAYIFEIQPEGNTKRSGQQTVPGFDCSGFVWWVYKHAELSDFYSRQGADTYEIYAKDKGYIQVCGFPSNTCTKELMASSAQAGDLIFLYTEDKQAVSHVAIYVASNTIIDSSGDRNGVDKRPLPDTWYRRMTVYRFAYNSGCTAAPASTPSSSDEVSLTASNIPPVQASQTGTQAQANPSAATATSTAPPVNIAKEDYDRIMQYSDAMKKASETYGVPVAIIQGVMMQESRGIADAKSGTGCAGVMQFCGSTAKAYDLCDNSYCTGRDDRYDPLKSIDAGAHYLGDLLKRFKKYSQKDAFAIASYNGGEGTIQRAIDETGKDDPSWQEVALRITPNLIYSTYCNGGKSTSGWFCGQGAGCVNSNCFAKVNEILNYVDKVLRYYSAFGGTSFSFSSSYEGIVTSFTKEDIGFYYVNPSFTATVNYNLSVYEQINQWARKVYGNCSGSQKPLKDCVAQEKASQNTAYATLKASQTVPADGSQPVQGPEYKFFIEENAVCDGVERGYYQFIETFENCFEFGKPSCKCDFGMLDLRLIKSVVLTNTSIMLKRKDLSTYYYPFPKDRAFNIYHNGGLQDSISISVSTGIGKEWYQITYTKDSQSTTEGKPGLYLVKNIKTSQDGQASVIIEAEPTQYVVGGPDISYPSEKCDLVNQQHKFRFCVSTPDKMYKYNKEYDRLKAEDVKIKFALDLFKAPPPPITADNVAIDKLDDARQSEATANKQCEGLGQAEFDLKVTTENLEPAFGGWITDALGLLAPQLKVLLFAQNFLMDKDNVPAMVTVKLDLKGASKDCDIVGLVYKCGTGIQPLIGGKFDFSNPTGYIDLSQRFNSGAGYSAPAPTSCMSGFNNPDGTLMQNPLPYVRPSIDPNNNDIISFSVEKCAEPILQFKRMPGLDIISSILSGFNYYFAFAYVDSSGNYGPATIKGAEVPPIFDKLMEQLGFANTGLLGIIQGLDSDIILDGLGSDLVDELSAIRKAVGSLSLDRMLTNLKGEALNTALGKVASVIKDEDARELFNTIAKDGRINDADAAILLQPIRDELQDTDALNLINKMESVDLSSAYNSIQQLPLDQKKELLGEVYDSPEDIADMGEKEIDESLDAAMQKKDDAVKILQSLNPGQRVDAVKTLMDQAPSKILQAANDIIPDEYKITSIRSVMTSATGELTGAQGELTRLMAYYSPDYVKKQVMTTITDTVPGFGQYKDVLNLVSGLPGQSCSVS